MRLTIGKKIIFGFILVIAIYLINSVYTNININNMNNGYHNLINKRARTAILSMDMKAAALEKVASFRGYIINGDTKKLDSIRTCNQKFQEDKNEIEQLLITEEGKNALKKLVASNEEYDKLIEQVKEYKQNNQMDKINEIISGEGAKVVSSVIENANTISTLAQGLLEKGEGEQSTTSSNIIRMSMIINICVVIVSIVLAVIISRLISTPVKLLSKKAEMIAGGDLTISDVVVRSRDEVGELADSFNRMLHSLRQLVQKVKASSELVSASAQELMAGSESTSAAAEEISASIQNVSSSIGKQKDSIDNISTTSAQLSAGIEATAASMQDINGSSASISRMSEKGQQDLAEVVGQMNIISESSSESVTSVRELGRMSRNVEEIINLIGNISSQTNLLALNAAIEAARAGEQGKGFAVVAEEVRKLADQSRTATQEIVNTIKSMNAEIEKVAVTIESGAEEIQKGAGIVHGVDASFKDISKGYGSIFTQVQDVSAAMQEMTAGMQEVVSSIHIIVESANTNSSCANDVTAAIEEQTATMEEITTKATVLATLSNELEAAAAVFRV